MNEFIFNKNADTNGITDIKWNERIDQLAKVSNTGFIMVHEFNDGHIAPSTDNEFQLRNCKHLLKYVYIRSDFE